MDHGSTEEVEGSKARPPWPSGCSVGCTLPARRRLAPPRRLQPNAL